MEYCRTRWVCSEGVFLFQVPEISSIISTEDIMLLSSSLYAVSVFFEYNQIKFEGEKLSIVRINFHPPISSENECTSVTTPGYVIHSSSEQGISIQSIFYANMISNLSSEFEKAFLDSILINLLETIARNGKRTSDIQFLHDRTIITETESMLQEIDSNYNSLVDSWTLAQGPNGLISRFDFVNVLYNGKIRIEELFYDLGERAYESFNELLMSKEEKIILYKIAKSLVNLSSLLYEELSKVTNDLLKFTHSEIILEASSSKKLYRLDVRSYDISGESFCDITIMSN